MGEMLALAAALLLGPGAHGTVRTDSLWSQALATYKHYEVYLPPSYGTEPARRYPVAYYLHGLYGSETDWVEKGHLNETLDSLIAGGMPEMIVVMPDADDSWYTTWNALGNYRACMRDTVRKEPAATYCVRWPHYDDYIARDLVHHVDSTYRTIPDRAHRAIAGLSMGGYGAVSLALEYPEVWSAAASHSGVLSPMYDGPHPFSGRDVYATRISELEQHHATRWKSMELAFGRDLAGWEARDPLTRLRRLRAEHPALVPALFIDVGRDDPFIDENRAFHAELDSLHVPNHYAEWPGAHTWPYWRAHAVQSLVWVAAHIARRTPRGARRHPLGASAPVSRGARPSP